MGRTPAKRDKAPGYRAKIFRNGRSQALRLPKELRFEGQTEVSVRREGNRLIVEPLDAWSEAFLKTAGSDPQFQVPKRTPLREARDRFAR
jgi:antitoxin VapB